jgi:hypothetical protein
MLNKLAVAAAAAILVQPLAAHHANSAYDREQSVTVTGIVSAWQFINPHAGLWLNVTDDSGATIEWSAEFQGTLDLYRHFSWNKDTFKPGDTITVTGSPARAGAPPHAPRVLTG